MKGFWVSLCVFCLMLAGVFGNARYIRRTTQTLQEEFALLESADDPAKAARGIDEFWKKERKRVMLSVSYLYIAEMDRVTAELISATNREELLRVARLGSAAAENIGRSEKITFETVF